MSGSRFSSELEVEASRYRDEIFAAIRSKSGDANLAEDIAQETLARVLARLQGEGLQDPAKLQNFMHRVAANVLREMRRANARQVREPRFADDEELGSEELFDSRARSEESKLIWAESISEEQFQTRARSEQSKLIWAALDEIGNDDYREVLIRFFLHDEPRQKICEELGISARAFTQRLFRAKRSLKSVLEKLERRHGLRLVEI